MSCLNFNKKTTLINTKTFPLFAIFSEILDFGLVLYSITLKCSSNLVAINHEENGIVTETLSVNTDLGVATS
jgi:hypothetical protein